jgi:glycerol-3-phosphate acyltransferase PlsY
LTPASPTPDNHCQSLPEIPAMLLLTKVIHVLAVGLWFGTAVFFSFVVGLSLFSTFESLSVRPAGERPYWFPLPAELDRSPPSKHFPDPLRKEQGSRVAGEAVSPLFTWYYSLQLACGAVALLTALAWLPWGTVHQVRVGLVALGLVGVAVGWWMEHKVSELRQVRSQASDAVLKDPQPSPEAIRAADAARAEFGKWHGYSLIINLVTVAVVTAAMTLAAQLPAAALAPGHSPEHIIPSGGSAGGEDARRLGPGAEVEGD